MPVHCVCTYVSLCGGCRPTHYRYTQEYGNYPTSQISGTLNTCADSVYQVYHFTEDHNGKQWRHPLPPTPRPAPVHTVEILRSHCGYYHSLLYMLPTMHVSRLLYQVPTIASALKFDLVCFLHDACSCSKPL